MARKGMASTVAAVLGVAALGVAGGMAGQPLLSDSASAASTFRVTPDQLRINQRISQAAVKRVNAVRASIVMPQTLSIGASGMVPHCASGAACSTSLMPGGLTVSAAGSGPAGVTLRAPLLLPAGGKITEIEIVGIDPLPTDEPRGLAGHLTACVLATVASSQPVESACVTSPGGSTGGSFVSASQKVRLPVRSGHAYLASINVPDLPGTPGSAAALMRVTYRPLPPFYPPSDG